MSGYQHIQQTIKKRLNAFEKRLLLLVTKEHAIVAVIIFFLSAIFFAIVALDTYFVKSARKNKVVSLPFVFSNPAPYPVVSSVLGASTQNYLSAQAALVMDNDSKVVLFAKNPNVQFSMASTTKIMTALIGLEYFSLDDVLTVKREHVEGSTIRLQKGEKLRFIDLLYAMMLPSANDAAYVIVDNYPGGETAFVEKMNKKAIELHLLQTHYADPAGLDDDGDYTTVLDLAHLGSYAMKNPTLSEIAATKQKVITSALGNTYVLTNLNKLLGIDGVRGMKTGFTEEALGVLVTSKEEKGKALIIVVMKSLDRFADTQTLLSLISGQVEFEPMSP